MALKTRTLPRSPSPEPDDSLGWQEVYVDTPNGGREWVQIPLTLEEVLHPEIGYVIAHDTEHTPLCRDMISMLQARYAREVNITVFSDLIVEWEKPELKHHCPDIMVIPSMQNPKKMRERFIVEKEGTRPSLLIEVVSPESKKADRITKVDHYARAEVLEYVYIDRWDRGNEVVWEIAGFRLTGDRYLPMLPDEEGSISCETVGLRIGLKDGEVWMQDYETGEFLMNNLEAQSARLAAETRAEYAEAKLAEEKAARDVLEARLKELEGRE